MTDTEIQRLRRALAALTLHATGNNGPRDGNPYGYSAVVGAIAALFPSSRGPWDVSADEVRALAQEPALVDDVAVLSLLVKGDRHKAVRTAAERGIPAVFVREQERDSLADTTETLLHVGTQHEARVAEWFGAAPHGAPYPAGTLLHYGTTRPDRARALREGATS